MEKGMNKAGQGMSISTIILLILGIVILVVLVLGFAVGWNKILPFISQDNVATVSNQCQVACTQNSVYDFCTKSIDLTVNSTTFKSNCYDYSTNASYSSFGIAVCPALQSSCPQAIPAE
ncbi:MAG: hypothetical protein PHH00_03675 [Candidatus Nanoarchaeia archaeon]|nr:hypothetical protein [Candidatus Nanoarchaeia archaeon]